MDLHVIFTVFMAVSMVVFVSSIALSIVISRMRSIKSGNLYEGGFLFSPLQIFLIGFFISAILLYFPISYVGDFANENEALKIIKSIIFAIHNTMKAFLLEADFLEFKEVIMETLKDDYTLSVVYSTYALVFSFVAPILTASFVLMLFNSISTGAKYTLNTAKNIYYISELNEKSIALAYDIKINGKKGLTVFCNVDEKDEEKTDLVDKAKRLGALCFGKDISSINYKAWQKNAVRKFYFIAEDENDNLNKSLSVIKRCRENKNLNKKATECYVFAHSLSSEALLNATDFGNLKVRRINAQRNLVYKTLSDYSIFKNNIPCERGYKLNILIVGFGRQGIEFLKTLCWYGQMNNYELNVHVFDQNPEILSLAKSIMPEIIEYNGKEMEGEPYYNINFYGDTDVSSNDFNEKIKKIGKITTAYVILGDDQLNIETSIKLSTEYARLYKDGLKDLDIFAVVYNAMQNQVIKENSGLNSAVGSGYNITLIGDTTSRYSLESIEMLEDEKVALDCHMKWVTTCDEKTQEKSKRIFEKYEYYRRSSMSEAVHKKARASLKVPNGEKIDRYSSNTVSIDILEHKRWNAYMRSEGFVRGESKNFIAKTHQDLIPFEQLTEEVKLKDLIVSGGE